MAGNASPYAAKASDSAIPDFSFSRTSVRTSLNRRFFCRSSMMSNDCRMGRPALTSASSSWLKSRKCSVEMIFLPRGRRSRSLVTPRRASKTCIPCWRSSSSAARTLIACTWRSVMVPSGVPTLTINSGIGDLQSALYDG